MSEILFRRLLSGLGVFILVGMFCGAAWADCPEPFCDSVTAYPCVDICPSGDIPYVVTVKDSCGDPVCDPGLYIDFSDCPTVPCQQYETDWPLSYPDSCNPATGEHYFHIQAGSLDCITCTPTLYVNNEPCRTLDVKFLDIDGDLCVTDTDWLGVEPCNDYNCNGFIDDEDEILHMAHLNHCCDPPVDTCGADTLLINSGYNQIAQSVYAIGDFDAYWTVTCDPDPLTTEPRPSSAITPNSAWAPALPMSQWISSYPMNANPLNGLYCYQFCFCLDDNFSNAELYIELRADDSAAVYLNGNFVVSTPQGSFNTPSPTTYLEIDQAKFQPGKNCITIEMSNVFGVASGLNVAGYVTADGIGLEQSYCCDSSGTVMGTKWLDEDGDCVQGSTEPGLAGWTIVLNPGGYTAVTDVYGNYYFTGIPPGTYTVSEQLQPSWIQVCPPSGTYNITLGVNQVISGLDFGNIYDCDQPGQPFCDSVKTDPCMVVCPNGDIPFKVMLADTCGNSICDVTTAYLDFSECGAQPCQQLMPNWPLVYADSCDPATGVMYFNPAAGVPECITCDIPLYVNGELCKLIRTKFLDVTGDLCVFPDDWQNAEVCNDYNCDNVTDAADLAIHNAHLDHCCGKEPCEPGPPFCDSTMYDPCLVICPLGDIPYSVIVKDSCGNPICDPTNVWIDFSQCPTEPCSTQVATWPKAFPDSCDPATGEHIFNIHASSLDCIDCNPILYINGQPCAELTARFLDINGDLCVTPNDFLGAPPCNDYDCDGDVDADDQAFHQSHWDHCCADTCSNQMPGDVDGDGDIDADDAKYLNTYVNSGGPAPIPQANGDVNGDCCISQADVDYLNAWFLGAGPAPVDCTCVDPPLCDCQPGDANNDGTINIGDAVYLINHVFGGGPGPGPYAVCSGDANCDCTVNIGDAVYLINYIFNNGAPPCDCCRWLALCGAPLHK